MKDKIYIYDLYIYIYIDLYIYIYDIDLYIYIYMYLFAFREASDFTWSYLADSVPLSGPSIHLNKEAAHTTLPTALPHGHAQHGVRRREQLFVFLDRPHPSLSYIRCC